MHERLALHLAGLQIGRQAGGLFGGASRFLTRSLGLLAHLTDPLLEPPGQRGRQIERGDFSGDIHAAIIPEEQAQTLYS
jgi:hypothetical protein